MTNEKTSHSAHLSGTFLVTGGAGYIGSHTCVELLRAGHDVIVIDNLCNSKASVMARIGKISGCQPVFIAGDIRDNATLEQIFSRYSIDAVLHFAGLKAVGESVMQPLKYYDTNVNGSLVLFAAMAKHGVKKLVFSSSATVYGVPDKLPIKEDFPLAATNPYGRTKIIVEDMLRDLAVADPGWQIALLRYFNPVGAHECGLIGEDPRDIPNNLMPYISQVASGKLEMLSVFGDTYPTLDGTGVRDYIHVVDLAKGHLAALDYIRKSAGIVTVNLGTGRGYSVLELVRAFERESGRKIPYRITEPRAGDIAACYADSQLAETLLGWRAELGIERMCRDAWRWQQWATEYGLD
jgi:UDP-glucose 4-epimerase